MTRLLLQETMMELSDRAERNWNSETELELVRSELMHRSTSAAKKLRLVVESRIEDLQAPPRPADVEPSPLTETQIEFEDEWEEPVSDTADQQPERVTTDPALRKLFEDTRKRLVETGTRNRLVHVNRKNVRANVVNIVNERSDDVYGILSSPRTMRFRAIGKDKHDREGEGEESELLLLANAGDEDFDEGRYSDNQLEVNQGPDALQKRLLKIAREARTAEEEQGINILYLALGFMTWFEDKSSSVQREAPLVLLPVELKRNEKTSTYDVQIRGDDIVTNLPLARRLKDDFGLDLPDLEAGEDWKPSDYFALVEEAISERQNWSIDRDGMQLGFFSFAKLLMFLDLDPDRWPDGSLEKHGLVKGLLHEGFDGGEPAIGGEDRLDEVLPPSDIFHVVDADSSQAKAIEEVRRGRNLVIQGPPGTGKSQTITNIIATAAREGKTVLFVAEKMAALSVVHDRLVKTGLADICLELHSKASNKKAVLGELSRTLTAAGAVPNMPEPPEHLTEVRDQLNGIAEELHKPIGETGETAFNMLARQARYLGQGVTPPKLSCDAIGTMSRTKEDDLVSAIHLFSELIEELGPAEKHPFYGIKNLALEPVDLERFNQRIETAQAAVTEYQAVFTAISDVLEIDTPCNFANGKPLDDLLTLLDGMPLGSGPVAKTILEVSDKDRLLETLLAGEEWRKRYDAMQGYFVDAAFESPAAHLRGPLVAGERSFFARIGSAYRNASRELAGLLADKLPKKASERLALLDDLLDLQSRNNRWNEDAIFCANALGNDWRGARTNFALLAEVAHWSIGMADGDIQLSSEAAVAVAVEPANLMKRQRHLAATLEAAPPVVKAAFDIIGLDGDALGEGGLKNFAANLLENRLAAMVAAIPSYKTWTQYSSIMILLSDAGISELADQIGKRTLTGEEAATELRFARAEYLWNRALNESPILKKLRDLDRHSLVNEYKDLEQSRFKENVATILSKHLSQVPRGALGEMKVIRGELARKRAHMALRKLFTKAPTALRRIKPILLMSPISVAQFLEPGLHEFDLLVIDEASQVRPQDALGAIARARQIVVVGDQKQLPPTSFFDRLLGDGEAGEDDDEEVDDLLEGAAKLGELESVLSLCEARGLGSRMLEWHYRSRDPSLIQVSNREFYKDGLILPPSPLQNDPNFGLCFTKVDGAYDRGGKRDNRIEGEAIVSRVSEHARETPKLSLGVVTFSSAQRNLITELLELARRKDTTLDSFLREGKAEDFFVKNIENVQGDERDVILVSVGYGPAVSGGPLTSMTFGPMNREGGERRLNVLFTRARLRCEIFASFEPSAMDTSRVSKEGPKILKRFLEFAQSGQLTDKEITGDPADSPFEEDVADEIRSLGFIADNQVGSAGFRIDLGIRDPDFPGTYIMAVECDGATYHSALWARERDRLRQGVLEHLGWRFHRIWSTDWFYNRSREIDRLRSALEAARTASEAGVEVPGSNQFVTEVAPETMPSEFEVPDLILKKMPAYDRSEVFASYSHEPHEVRTGVLADIALKIVETEGPIHEGEAARRMASAFGKEQAGSRIKKLTVKALRQARQNSAHLRDQDGFWFTVEQRNTPPVRDRSEEDGSVLKAANISLLEIGAALDLAREENAGGDDDDLIRTVAKLFGFKRVGPDLRSRIQESLRTS